MLNLTEAVNDLRVWMLKKHFPARLINKASALYLLMLSGKEGKKVKTKCDACKEKCICRVCSKNDTCKHSTREDCKKCLECGHYKSFFDDMRQRYLEGSDSEREAL